METNQPKNLKPTFFSLFTRHSKSKIVIKAGKTNDKTQTKTTDDYLTSNQRSDLTDNRNLKNPNLFATSHGKSVMD